MSTFVLHTKATRVTAAKVAERLGAEHGTKLPKDYTSYDRLIRWGASHAAYADMDVLNVLNKAKRVAQISNRHHMFQCLRHIGVKHLMFSNVPTTWNNQHNYVLRTRFGRWGNDIRCKTAEEIYGGPQEERTQLAQEGYFSVQRWLADFEVRVHIVNNICVCMQIKRQKDVEENIPIREWHIRNRKHGWHLYPLSSHETRRLHINKFVLRNIAKQVIAGAHLQFGVVDFLVRTNELTEDMDYRVLEVNTAPGLEDYTLDRYITRLEEIEPVVEDGALASPSSIAEDIELDVSFDVLLEDEPPMPPLAQPHTSLAAFQSSYQRQARQQRLANTALSQLHTNFYVDDDRDSF